MPPVSEKPVVCCVTAGKFAGSGPGGASRLLKKIREAVAAGADWVQIREKDLPARELLALEGEAVAISRKTAQAGQRIRIIVNDRLDVALASGADGVHLGRASVDAAHVVRWCRAGNAPPEFLVGVSCHSAPDAREAEQAGASYVFLGPVFDTPEKRAWGAPLGVTVLRAVCSEVRIPVIAIGGVNAANASECFRAGAAGFAAIRMFQEAADLAALRNVIERLHART